MGHCGIVGAEFVGEDGLARAFVRMAHACECIDLSVSSYHALRHVLPICCHARYLVR